MKISNAFLALLTLSLVAFPKGAQGDSSHDSQKLMFDAYDEYTTEVFKLGKNPPAAHLQDLKKTILDPAINNFKKARTEEIFQRIESYGLKVNTTDPAPTEKYVDGKNKNEPVPESWGGEEDAERLVTNFINNKNTPKATRKRGVVQKAGRLPVETLSLDAGAAAGPRIIDDGDSLSGDDVPRVLDFSKKKK